MSARSTTQSASGSVRGSVKLAGEEAKDRMYEPKHNKKVVRVLTVIAYVFSVSLAAIMLSLYYIFIWQGTRPIPNTPAPQAVDLQCRPSDGRSVNQEQIEQIVNSVNEPAVYSESQMAETPRALPVKEEPEPPTTPLSRLAQQYSEMMKKEENYSLPVLLNSK